ncbi:MAG: hypothetical protein A2201_05440 [Alicyclobacillus sp. RIFOXYA1_FULL_53_8]|nr:MAG: hypothetical protein A2201_05440 [Alicyclobacillus sp. RIFOXYA1_FULL_53_8]
MSKFIIYGPGRLGTAFAIALQTVGHDVLCAFAQDSRNESSLRFSHHTASPVYLVSEQAAMMREADAVLITVPDKAVSVVAQTLMEHKALRAGQVVLHTAGVLDSSVLASLRSLGPAVGSLHPLQTFADPLLAARRLHGVYCSLEGDAAAVAFATRMVQDLGAVPVVIAPDLRPRYHAAAVLASNALVALASVATDLLSFPQGLQALLPLMRGAMENLETIGLPGALTGPIERGDKETIQVHLNALKDNPTALHVYTALGHATVEVAARKNSLTQAQQQALATLFAPRIDSY